MEDRRLRRRDLHIELAGICVAAARYPQSVCARQQQSPVFAAIGRGHVAVDADHVHAGSAHSFTGLLVGHDSLDAHMDGAHEGHQTAAIIRPLLLQFGSIWVFSARQFDGDVETVGENVVEV